MVRIIDTDNMTGFEATEEEVKRVKEEIEAQRLFWIDGDVVELEDALDFEGNICLDEDPYDKVKEILGR